MAAAYCLHYENDGYETLGIEVPFELPILDTVTGKNETGRTYCGIVDEVVRRNGEIYLGDHKTASRVTDDYWTELKTNPQLTHYWLAARQCGIDIAGFLWDVTVKPSTSPKKLTKKAVEELEDGTYCGLPCSDKRVQDKETPEQYGTRLLADYTKDPKKYFFRRIITRTTEQILDHLTDLNMHAKTLAAVRDNEHLRYPNYSACKSFNEICEFHRICSGDDPDRMHFCPQRPRETPNPFSDKAISPSQINCHLLCRKKWTFKYLDKIEPIQVPYREALSVGSLFHKCMEFFLEDRRGNESIEFKEAE